MAYVRQKTNQRAMPVWAGDFGGRDHILPFPGRIDPAQFADAAGVRLVVAAGSDVDVGDTTIPINPVVGPILPFGSTLPSSGPLVAAGTMLTFLTPGTTTPGLPVRVTAPVNIGDSALTVEAVLSDISAGDTAVYSRWSTRSVLSGTLCGRTYAERDARTGFGPADVGGDDEIFLLLFDVPDALDNPDAVFYRENSVVKENYLPGYAEMISAVTVADPTAGPTVAAGGSGNHLAPGTYYVAYSFTSPQGETNISPLSSVAVAAGQLITVTAIALGSGATGINYYVSVTPGTQQLAKQGSNLGGADYLITGPGLSPLPPLSNTTGGTASATLTKIRALYRCIRGEG